jgi:hypothetical protein
MNMQVPRKIKLVFNKIRHKKMEILRRLSFDISLENDISGLLFIIDRLLGQHSSIAFMPFTGSEVQGSKVDELVKSQLFPFTVIPAKAGIQ